MAQSEPAPLPADEGSLQSTDEIVVTARRRDENLGKVPVAITAFGEEALASRQIATQSDLQRVTPGLVVRETQNRNQQNFAIRGQTIDAYSQAQPGVLTYTNEFQNPVVSASSFYDLASIQVLKGPQGTLFGRNSTGGAVLITTNPAEIGTFEGSISLQAGNFDERKVTAVVNIPAGDKLAFRFAGSLHRRDGYVENLVTGQDLGSIRDTSFRASVQFEPSDRISNSLTFQYDRGRGLSDPLLMTSVNLPGSTTPDGQPLTTTVADFYGPGLDALAGPGAYAALLAQTPGASPQGIAEFVQRQLAAGPWKTWVNTDLAHRSRGISVVNRTIFELGSGATIKNVFGYARNKNRDGIDGDGSPYSIVFNQSLENNNESFSDELTLSGEAFSDKLTYIAGVYFSRTDSDQTSRFAFLEVGPIANPLFGFPLSNVISSKVRDTTQAIFAQGTYDLDGLAPGLKFTAGARYTWEKINFTELTGFAPVYPTGVVEKMKESKPSWNIGFDYEVNDDLLIYVAHRGSWRTGGFNGSAPPVDAPASAGGNRFEAETTKDVELGFKYNGRLGDMPARLNVAGYNQWVKNVQRVIYVVLPTGLTGLSANVPGQTRYYGLEADWMIRPAPWLEFGGSYALAKGKYASSSSVLAFGKTYDFNSFADMPKHSGSAYVQVNADTGSGAGEVFLRGDIYAQSAQFYSNSAKTTEVNTRIAPYELINFSAGLNNIGGTSLSVIGYVKNATNKKYYVGGIPQSDLLGYDLSLPGRPRFYGVEVKYSF